VVATGTRTPFFAFVHLYDVHAPYAPHRPGETPSPFFERLAPGARVALLDDPAQTRHLIDLYDGEVAYVDSLLGPFLERVRALGVLERTLVVVTSDHGESLGEHDVFADHVGPHRVEIHVPLFIRLPNGRLGATRVAGPAQLQDLPATIRDLLGLSIAVPGVSLANALKTGQIPPRLLFAAGQRDPSNGSSTLAVRDGRFALLREPARFERAASRLVRPAEHLFDTRADPLETRDLLASDAGTGDGSPNLGEWRAALDALARTIEAQGDVPPAAAASDVDEKLHRLGYAR
jgi:arylsulfatase A-like enzyme